MTLPAPQSLPDFQQSFSNEEACQYFFAGDPGHEHIELPLGWEKP